MDNNMLNACQTLAILQENLLKIQVAIKNRVINFEMARQHIHQLIETASEIEKTLGTSTLTSEFIRLANNVLEQSRIEYSTNNYASK